MGYSKSLCKQTELLFLNLILNLLYNNRNRILCSILKLNHHTKYINTKVLTDFVRKWSNFPNFFHQIFRKQQ